MGREKVSIQVEKKSRSLRIKLIWNCIKTGQSKRGVNSLFLSIFSYNNKGFQSEPSALRGPHVCRSACHGRVARRKCICKYRKIGRKKKNRGDARYDSSPHFFFLISVILKEMKAQEKRTRERRKEAMNKSSFTL